jgi:hypothetical protein
MLEYVVSVSGLASLQNLEATLAHDVSGNGSSVTSPQAVECLTVLSESSSRQNIGGKNLPERARTKWAKESWRGEVQLVPPQNFIVACS